jgi:HPt (histidine-containing phosphotransfer) domain-containing protein
MQDIETAKSQLNHFLEQSAAQINSLNLLTKEKDWKEAHRIAHSIKGSSRTLSGMELGNTAAILEAAYKQVDNTKIEATLPKLTEVFNSYKKAAEEFIQS